MTVSELRTLAGVLGNSALVETFLKFADKNTDDTVSLCEFVAFAGRTAK